MPLYWSYASRGQVIARGAEPVYHPTLPVKTGHLKELVAEFGVAGDEYDVIDPSTGQTMKVADIRGHYFDSDEYAEKQKLTPEDKEMLEAALQRACNIAPEYFKLVTTAPPGEPIPGWGKLSAARKIALAAELPILGEAVAWEQHAGTDPELIVKLEKKLAEQQAAESAEDSLTTV